MPTLYEQLRDAWVKCDISLNRGVASDTIIRLEEKYCIKMPIELHDYLRTVNGMAEGETDVNMISFLTLDAIEHELSFADYGAIRTVSFIFADYLIFSHYYLLRSKLDGTQIGVFAADGTNEKLISKSFNEFIEAYLSESASIAHCWDE
jgi:hypothetical protein